MIPLTIFTSTYNRAHTLSRLYDSLLRQTSKDFEWLIIDDGSSDNTFELLESWNRTGSILALTYIKTSNGGKHRAINKGVNLATGELFFIVDSDDFLTDNAVEEILKEWEAVKHDKLTGGLCFRKANSNTGQTIGKELPSYRIDSDSIEINFIYQVKGDKAEIFRTSVLKSFPFDEFEGENFVPEALVWNRIAREYKLRFIDRSIYICEYLEDGLSRNFYKNFRKNPQGFGLYYCENMRSSLIPIIQRMKFFLRYIQCQVYKLTS